ncbi:MAG: hypothetical protein EP343_16875 [Deltaproteobacteria bacterium]|nr:MAG: hypothetical protein EP343_16875 [Deltaproteobacteria bacterium]
MVTFTPGHKRIPLLESRYKRDWVEDPFGRKTLETSDVVVGYAELTNRDKVIIRDTWNKFQAHQDVALEAFVERVYYEHPSLEGRMGVLGDEAPEILFGLFDLCIRSLLPHTENLGREAAQPAHADPDIQWKTIDDYARWFAEIGCKVKDWEVIGRVWLWALDELFILEELERDELRKGRQSAFYRFYHHFIYTPIVKAIREFEYDPLVRVAVDLLDRHDQRLLKKAQNWLSLIAEELQWSPEKLEERLDEVEEELLTLSTYTQTQEELEYGARVAWRNAVKCIGRVHWKSLKVRDCREVIDPDEMFQEILGHLREARGEGSIQSVITVFRAKEPHERWGPRLWNTQFLRYAGYRMPDGSILGDPDNLHFTEKLQEIGWNPPQPKGEFDLLPIVIDVPGEEPRMYELPRHLVDEVEIHHPTIPAIGELGLKWYAIPVISNIGLDLGGLRYTLAPFNGWFMGTEIARDLLDEHRYNKAEAIAVAMGLDTSSEQTLWRDRVHLEVNVAILHSFREQRLTLVDHHTASRQFLVHDRREKMAGRECPARWSWIVPPMSSSSCPVFHHEMREFLLDPQYRNQYNRWEVLDADTTLVELEAVESQSNIKVLILFGSESGTAETFAFRASKRLQRLNPSVMAMNDCKPEHLASADLLLVITSTFGVGELPNNARDFAAWLQKQPPHCLDGMPFGVMGIGSSIYEHYCAGGIKMNELLAAKGGKRLLPLHKGDEMSGQAQRMNTWLERIARVFGMDSNLGDDDSPKLQIEYLEKPPTTPTVRLGEEVEVRLLENVEMLQGEQPPGRSARLLTLEADDPRLSYEPGDHLGVFPVNSKDVVLRLCEQLKVSPHAWFRVKGGKVPFPLPNTPFRVFSEELDLTLHGASMELLQALKQSATSSQDQIRLDNLLEECSRGADSEVADKHLATLYPHLPALLDDFPSTSLSLAQAISLLPKQKARYYSIASCSTLEPGRLSIAVSLVQVPLQGEQTRPGLCSHYLATSHPGQMLRVFRSRSEFHHPKDPTSPMLLVGPGTGVAPLVGMLQYREFLWKKTGAATPKEAGFGAVWLFFGCRNTNDYLFQSELERLRDCGIIDRLDVAFSRLPGENKVYVQHRMQEQSQAVWAFLQQESCHAYLCGDTHMADDVMALWKSLGETEGGLEEEASQSFLKAMASDGRLLKDVWSLS